MLPDKKLITILNNKKLIEELLSDLVLKPRIEALKWSKITKQTPNMKVGYPGQHLASLVLGMEGEKTGARGHDIVDGSEVKSCSRVDQLDTCKDCGEKVLRIENSCPNCDSTNIDRRDDSKWIFTIRSENDLKVLTQDVDRIVLILVDYVELGKNDNLHFQVFEIWTKSPRSKNFVQLMSNYYNKLYLEHKMTNPNETPAPCNFWPFSYQFYMCNPIKVLNCIAKNANSEPKIEIDYYVSPEIDRNTLPSEMMPIQCLEKEQILRFFDEVDDITLLPLLKNGKSKKDLKKVLKEKKELWNEILPYLDEKARTFLELREMKKRGKSKTKYARS
jgi:hypothetical protein